MVLCKTKPQAEKALQAVKACIEDELGLELSPEKTHTSTFRQGFKFLGFYLSANTIRMGEKAEDRFKEKVREITKRNHNLSQEVIIKLNQVIRGTVNYFGAGFATCLHQFNKLDKWIRKRIRCMKYKRIWRTDNRRMKNTHIRRTGLLTCREAYLSAS